MPSLANTFKIDVVSAKFLNLITWVKFDNEECAADTGDNGTCFTRSPLPSLFFDPILIPMKTPAPGCHKCLVGLPTLAFPSFWPRKPYFKMFDKKQFFLNILKKN